MQNQEEQRLSEVISVAMGSVANTGSALKIIADMQSKNDSLAYQNIVLAMAINSIRSHINAIADEISDEYPEEKVIPSKLRNIAKSKQTKSSQILVGSFVECIHSIKAFAASIPATPANMEAWYGFLESLSKLGLHNEIKGPSSSNTNGPNPVPGYKRS